MNTKTLIFFLVGAVCMNFTAGVVVDCDHLPEPLKDPHACCPTPHLISDQLIEKCKHMEGSSSESHESEESDANKVKPHVHHHHHHRHAGAAHEHGTPVFQRIHVLLHHPRFIKCVFTETGIVENEKLNEVKLSEHMKVAMKDAPEMIPVYEQSFKSCVAKYEEFKANTSESHHHHHAEPMMMACVFKESFTNCVPSLWSNTEECNEWREVLTTCKQDSHFWHNMGWKRVSDSSEEDKA